MRRTGVRIAGVTNYIDDTTRVSVGNGPLNTQMARASARVDVARFEESVSKAAVVTRGRQLRDKKPIHAIGKWEVSLRSSIIAPLTANGTIRILGYQVSAWGTETTFPNPVVSAFAMRLARIAESPLTATQKTQATNELVVNKVAYTAKFAWVGQQVLHSMAKTIREHVRAWWRVHNLPSAMIEAEREVGGVGIINIEARWHVEYLCTFVYALTSHDEHVRAAAWETILSLTSRTAAQRSTQVIINCTGIWIADASAMSMETNEILNWTCILNKPISRPSPTTRTGNNHEAYARAIVWILGAPATADDVSIHCEGIGPHAKIRLFVASTAVKPYKLRGKIARLAQDKKNKTFQLRFSSYRKQPTRAHLGAVGWGASFVPHRLGKIARPFMDPYSTMLDCHKTILLRAVIERWHTGALHRATNPRISDKCVCGRVENVGHILRGLTGHQANEPLTRTIRSTVRRRHDCIVTEIIEAIKKNSTHLIAAREGTMVKIPDGFVAPTGWTEIYQAIDTNLRATNTKPDVVVIFRARHGTHPL
jgi:hypothetical protein